MNAPSVAVKTTAKAILKGNFYKCATASLIAVFISLSIQLTASLLSLALGNAVSYLLMCLLNFFLLIPSILGLLRFFRRLMWDQNDNIIVVFHYFGDLGLYKKAIASGFGFVLRLFLIGIAVFLPSILLSILERPEIYEFFGINKPSFIMTVVEARSVLNVISTVVFLIIGLKYYLTPFLLVADEDMDVGEALHMSSVISKKSALDFVGLILSFSFWIIISFFLVPLPFTLPYIIAAYMTHCRFAVAHYNNFANTVNKTDIPFYSSEN